MWPLETNRDRNWYIFIQENAFENVVWKMAVICLGLNVLTESVLTNCQQDAGEQTSVKYKTSLSCQTHLKMSITNVGHFVLASYWSGHETAAVLLPGFAINW